MKAYIIVGKNIDLKEYQFETGSLLIGVDHGCLEAVKAGLHLDIAYGDFDSVSESELAEIEKRSEKVIRLNPVKDITDTEGAVTLADTADEIIILGGIQGLRIEHFLANLNLLRKYPKTIIEDDNTLIRRYVASRSPYWIKKGHYRFLSFFAIVPSSLSLESVKYPLKDYELLPDDSLCISNEIDGEIGVLLLKEGEVFCLQSKDDSLSVIQ